MSNPTIFEFPEYPLDRFVRLVEYRRLMDRCLKAEALCDALQRKLDAIEQDERLQ